MYLGLLEVNLELMVAWAVRPANSCDNNFVVEAAYYEISASTIFYIALIMLYIVSFMLYRISYGRLLPGFDISRTNWPDSCPSIQFDRTQWKRSDESLESYRRRVVHNFIRAEHVVTVQPFGIPEMGVDSATLTQEQIDQLKIVIYKKSVDLHASQETLGETSLQRKGATMITNPTALMSRPSTLERRNSTKTISQHINLSPLQRSKSTRTVSHSKLPDGMVEMDDFSNVFDLQNSSAVVVLSPAVDQDSTHHNSNNKTTDDTCALCLEDYLDGDRLRELGCEHRYHSECVDSWLLENKRVCPVCNGDALKGVLP